MPNTHVRETVFWKVVGLFGFIVIVAGSIGWTHINRDGHPVMEERVGNIQGDIKSIKKTVGKIADKLGVIQE